MQIETLEWSDRNGWRSDGAKADQAALVLYFAAPKAVGPASPFAELRTRFPTARIVGCSTGGEILGEDVLDDSAVAAAIGFDRATIAIATAEIAVGGNSRQAGIRLAQGLEQDGLRSVLVLADGTRTNGTALIAGLREVLPATITVTGGLAGDGADFRRTLVGCDGEPAEGMLVAIGFYGESLRIGWGSFGGWDRFGPERRITRAIDNVLFELDGEPALDLYKRYLGNDEAANLPGSALLFPLTIRPQDDENGELVRTIVAVDEDARSLIFAGDIPEGHVAQLMRGYFDGLVEGASKAGDAAAQGDQPVLALLISCIGRKLLMGQRIVDEVEAVAESLGASARLLGFYSYGEIAPHGFTGRCELHNQTMTITTIGEA
jgi:hypothetical protein